MKTLKDYVRELTNLQGNVGYEDDVIHYIVQELEDIDGDISIDSLGNITIHIKPDSANTDTPRVMIFGHSDEVGMMVKRIDDMGYITAEKLGSVNPTCLSGLKVLLQGELGTVNGVIGVKSHHLKHGNKVELEPSVQNVYIDVGAMNRDSVINAGIQVGTPISFCPQFQELLDDCVANKSMDDRALLAAILSLAKVIDCKQIKCDLYFVISVQEEFNTRGIMPTVREIKPHFVIGLDVTPATDTPDLMGYSEICLGNGPALTYMNHHSRGTLAGIVPNKAYLKYIEQLANEQGVNVQHEVATGILTETAYIAIEHVNSVVANISLPTRYTHTPIEVISMKDLEDIVVVLKRFIYDIDATKRFGKNIDIEGRINRL